MAITPPFEIRGIVHLRRVGQIRQALDDLPSEFIPMTDVEAIYLRDQRLRVAADLAMTNRVIAELFSLTSEGFREAARGTGPA